MKHEKNDQSTLKKYFGLILLVALFLLLTVALLGLSAWTTNRLAKNTQVINVAGEQGASIQQLSKNLMDINLISGCSAKYNYYFSFGRSGSL